MGEWNTTTGTSIVNQLLVEAAQFARLLTVHAATHEHHRVGSGTTTVAMYGQLACFDTARFIAEAAVRQGRDIAEFGRELIADHPADPTGIPALMGAAMRVIDPETNCVVGVVSLLGFNGNDACKLISSVVADHGFSVASAF